MDIETGAFTTTIFIGDIVWVLKRTSLSSASGDVD